MNTLELRVEKARYDDFDVVNPYIDGRSLLAIVSEYEARFIGQPGERETKPGGYDGLEPDRFISQMKYDWAKDVQIMEEPVDRVADDWDLLMNYDTKDGEVVWSGFHQPWRDEDRSGRPRWDYSDFPIFVFDKSLYRAEIEKVLEHCGHNAINNYNRKEVLGSGEQYGYYPN
jgi:hypothetical protein